jgi:tRNA threonylcarbamoyladenosine biosynthesis protein TsaB
MVLGIETSDILCSVAFWDEGKILAEYNHELPMQHAAIIGKLVEHGLKFLSGEHQKKKYEADDIRLVAVSVGPGSFTGLRIGLSYAQGFCFGRDIPIIGISNHQMLASFSPLKFEDVYSIIEARRDEVYLAKHKMENHNYNTIVEHLIVPKIKLADKLTEHSIILFKKDLILEDKIIDSLMRKHITIFNRLNYSAGLLAELGLKKYKLGGSDKLAEIEPMYIRPFAGVT